MEFTVLYSGSSGNCAYVKINNQLILIDAGVSCKRIVTGLERHNIPLESVKAILLTHEHTDHVIGLKQLVDKKGIKLYTNRKTFAAIAEKYRPVDQAQIVFFEDVAKQGEDTFQVELFEAVITHLPISHDVQDGRCFMIETKTKKFVYLTDSGYVSHKTVERLKGADAYVIESNHEPELVLQSRYPWSIQQRILSDKGHLSNQDCALLLQELVQEQTQHVVLAHLSEENNQPALAFRRVEQSMKEINRTDITILVAKPDNVMELPIVIRGKLDGRRE